MDRLIRAVGLVATFALVGYAAWLLLADSDADEEVEYAIADAARADDTEQQAQARIREINRRLALSPAGPDGAAAVTPEASPPSIVPYGSGEIDSQTARDGFEYAMGRVDAIVQARRRLSQDEWDSLYRETNDAFAALSIVLDASDEAQRAELEDAHQRLQQRLRKVKVRGKKFGR